MKVRIEDKEALQALSWESLKAYLDRSRDWEYAEDIPDKAFVYQNRDKSGRLREIVVPMHRDFGDYASRMADAVSTLARVEDRSELDVYDDLATPRVAMARKAHERIRKWLAEEGWDVREVGDPECSFNVMVTLNDKTNVNIFQRQDHIDHITLSQHYVFDEQSRSEIGRLPAAALRAAIYDIYRDVSIMGVDLTGLGIPFTEMTIRTYVYFDGLTKDTLIQRSRLTLRAVSLAIQRFVRALETLVSAIEIDQVNHPTAHTSSQEPVYSYEVEEAGQPSEPPSNVVRLRPRKENSAKDRDAQRVAS